MFGAARLLGLIVLLVTLHCTAALAQITQNADGSRWASGTFKIFVSDQSRAVKSVVSYWIHYWPGANSTARIDWVFLQESPNASNSYWIQYCYAKTCARTWQLLYPDRFRSIQPNWNVRLGSTFSVKVTNSIDPSGIWGETYVGVVTLR